MEEQQHLQTEMKLAVQQGCRTAFIRLSQIVIENYSFCNILLDNSPPFLQLSKRAKENDHENQGSQIL